MPPADRLVPRFAAEPPQEGAPYGRWASRLEEAFLGACSALEDAPAPDGPVAWHPDRTWHGRTYVPATVRTAGGGELFGHVSFRASDGQDEPVDLRARAEVADEVADDHPEWRLDLCDDVVGSWRGEDGNVAAMTLVWGTPLVDGGALATAELAGLAVDQCPLREGRFTLLAPDDYRGDVLDVRLWSARGDELAVESLYDE